MNQPVTAETIRSPRLQRILIVDDEKSVALTMQMALEEFLPNCELLTAFSSEQALQCFKSLSVDLLITDYCMPGANGLTLAAQIRRLYPETAIIMITADGNDELRRQAADLSICSVLDKPVKVAELRRVVSEALAEVCPVRSLNTSTRYKYQYPVRIKGIS